MGTHKQRRTSIRKSGKKNLCSVCRLLGRTYTEQRPADRCQEIYCDESVFGYTAAESRIYYVYIPCTYHCYALLSVAYIYIYLRDINLLHSVRSTNYIIGFKGAENAPVSSLLHSIFVRQNNACTQHTHTYTYISL